jgi:hypothetical protein
MNTLRVLPLAIAALVSVACGDKSGEEPPEVLPSTVEVDVPDSGADMVAQYYYGVPIEDQRIFMADAADSAWAYVARNFDKRTGLIGAHETYPFATIWDIGSLLGALYSAHDLGLISTEEYQQKASLTLETLASVKLFEEIAYGRMYSSRTAALVDREGNPSSVGFGFSALDLGRMLVWLRIIADNDSLLAPAAAAVAARIDMQKMTSEGYMQGVELDPKRGRRSYQEGRIGYEQYAAEGFARWGAPVEHALAMRRNAIPVEIMGQTILSDGRGDDVITSEPFVLMGIELGWNADWREQGLAVLAAQEARYLETGKITMIAEDAIPEPPTYFYYYLLRSGGKDFVVTDPLGNTSDKYPRWVSVKAAIGWHALVPSDYTWTALKAVEAARRANRGWSAGVIEGSGRPVRGVNINTVAVVLESAAFFNRGCPLVRQSCGAGSGAGPRRAEVVRP